MLLLWEYFWTEADWTGAPPSVSVSAADVVKFGSKGGDYHPLPDTFWGTRERYLKRFVEPTVARSREAIPREVETETINPRLITKATIAQAKLRALQTERDMLLEKTRIATNRQELQQQSARVLQLSLDILSANNQYYEQAAIILLLDIF